MSGSDMNDGGQDTSTGDNSTAYSSKGSGSRSESGSSDHIQGLQVGCLPACGGPFQTNINIELSFVIVQAKGEGFNQGFGKGVCQQQDLQHDMLLPCKRLNASHATLHSAGFGTGLQGGSDGSEPHPGTYEETNVSPQGDAVQKDIDQVGMLDQLLILRGLVSVTSPSQLSLLQQ